MRKSNKKLYSEAWKFYEEHARNISGTYLASIANYRIPMPDMSGEFIYADTVEILWSKFIVQWFQLEGLDAPPPQ